MAPDQERTLTRELLAKLSEIEASLEPSEAKLIQPATIDDLECPGGITVQGFDGRQIDERLRSMCRQGLISSGTAPYDGAAVGVFFSHLTPAGRNFLGR